VLVAEIEKLEAEAAEHALAFQKVIGERAADRSSAAAAAAAAASRAC
jgi:hypothetical protein